MFFNCGGCMNVIIDLLELKRVVDIMVENHKSGYNSMSSRATLVSDSDTLYIRQYCEYAECYPDVQSIRQIQ